MEREMQSMGISLLTRICQQLEINLDDIVPEDLPKLSSRLSETMRVCAGHQKANRVYQEIRKLADLERLAETAKTDENRLEAFDNLARASLFTGDWEKAKYYFKKLLHNAEVKRDRTATAKYLVWLGVVYKEKSEYDEAMIYFERALRQAEASSDPSQLSNCHYRIGDIYWYRGDYDNALRAYEKAGETATDNQSKGAAYVGIANVEINRHELSKAIEHYEKALDLLRETDDYLDIARAYNNLGDVYLQLEEWDVALDCFAKGEEYGEKGGWLNIKAWTQFNSGMALVEKGKFDAAKEILDKSKDILTVLDSKAGLAGMHHAYGRLYMAKKDWPSMIEHYSKAIEYYGQTKVVFYLAQVKLELGQGYVMMGDRQRGLDYMQEAARLYSQLKLDEMAKKAIAEVERTSGR